MSAHLRHMPGLKRDPDAPSDCAKALALEPLPDEEIELKCKGYEKWLPTGVEVQQDWLLELNRRLQTSDGGSV